MAYDNDHIETANIIIAGMTGCGKSTLVNAVFGLEGAAKAKTAKGLAVTEYISEYSSQHVPIKILDTVGLEINPEKTMRSIEDIKKRIRESGTSGTKDDFNINGIHAIWYCVNVGSSRYQQDELKFVKDLHSVGVPFIIVLTQCIQPEEDVDRFEEIVKDINRDNGMNDIEIVQVLAEDYAVRGIVIPSFGLDDLVDTTVKNLKGFVKNGFIAAQRINVKHKKELATSILHNYVKNSTGFLDKIPFLNTIKTQFNISDMFTEIATVYNSVLTEEDIETVWGNVWGIKGKFISFGGTLIPFVDFGASTVLNAAIRDGEIQSFADVGIKEFGRSDQSASQLAMFGDSFISAITEVWEENIGAKSSRIEGIVDKLVQRIKDRWIAFREKYLGKY